MHRKHKRTIPLIINCNLQKTQQNRAIYTYLHVQKTQVIPALLLIIVSCSIHNTEQGPVVQSIVSLTSSLRGQFVKCFTTSCPNTLIFFVEKMKEASYIFSTKILAYFSYYHLKF